MTFFKTRKKPNLNAQKVFPVVFFYSHLLKFTKNSNHICSYLFLLVVANIISIICYIYLFRQVTDSVDEYIINLCELDGKSSSFQAGRQAITGHARDQQMKNHVWP